MHACETAEPGHRGESVFERESYERRLDLRIHREYRLDDNPSNLISGDGAECSVEFLNTSQNDRSKVEAESSRRRLSLAEELAM